MTNFLRMTKDMSKKCPALLEQILEGVSLSEGEAHGLMHEMASGEMEPALAGAHAAGAVVGSALVEDQERGGDPTEFLRGLLDSFHRGK